MANACYTRANTKLEGGLVLKILGYIGLAITGIAGLMILLTVTEIIASPPFEAMVATFILGQAFFNGYIIAKLK